MNKRKFSDEGLNKKQKLDVDLEESTLIYELKFSLRRLSVASVVVQLWMQDDIQLAVAKDLMKRTGFTNKQNALKQIERQVFTYASTLLVPKLIYEMLLDPIERVGLEIFNWVEFQGYFFREVVSSGTLSDIVLRDYLHNISWTSMGQVDYKKTARSMISECRFSNISRFLFACRYCLVEEIKYSWNDVKSYEFSRGSSFVQFWMSTLNGISLTKESVQDMFYFAIATRNETAARYLWDQCGKLNCTMPDVVRMTESHNANFLCYVLSQVNFQKQQEIFEHSACIILECILYDWLWGDHFLSTLLYARKFIKATWKYWSLMTTVTERLVSCKDIYKCIKYKNIFKEMWQCIPKENLFMFPYGKIDFTLCIGIVSRLFHRKYIDIVQKILSDAESLIRKKILLSEIALNLCRSLLINKDWDLLEVFINYACDSEQDLDRLKALLRVKKRTAMFSYLTSDQWKQFFKLSSKSEEEINIFKRGLLYRDSGIVKKLAKDYFEDHGDIYQLELYLKWFLSSEEGLNEFKSTMFLNEPFCHSSWGVVFEILGKEQFDSLDMFVNWCFSNCKNTISNFKTNLLTRKDGSYNIYLFLNLIKKDDNLQVMQKCITWCSTNEEIQSKIKSTILNVQGEELGVCGSLLSKRRYKLADQVIAWCCCFSEVERYTFKNKYMLEVFHNKFQFESIVLNVYKQGYKRLQALLKWFNPSRETITKCKESNAANIPKRVLQIFDHFLRENTKREAIGSSV